MNMPMMTAENVSNNMPIFPENRSFSDNVVNAH